MQYGAVCVKTVKKNNNKKKRIAKKILKDNAA